LIRGDTVTLLGCFIC